MELKDFLRNSRINKGLTQEEYAELLTMKRGTLAHLEAGRTPSPDSIKKIVNYFHMPLNEILGSEKIDKMAKLETTNMLIDSLIKKGEIKENSISDEAKQLIKASLELEIKLKLELIRRLTRA